MVYCTFPLPTHQLDKHFIYFFPQKGSPLVTALTAAQGQLVLSALEATGYPSLWPHGNQRQDSDIEEGLGKGGAHSILEFSEVWTWVPLLCHSWSPASLLAFLLTSWEPVDDRSGQRALCGNRNSGARDSCAMLWAVQMRP